ncbi:hypothetical protein KP509_26G038600 [Ceratopteris richardii]|nr:hypothetical protein KP509_26G038600 [Ceratopteris richardii]
MHFLSEGPCLKATAQLKDELEEYGLLPRRYHAWYSRSGIQSGIVEDDGISVPLSYAELLERFSFIEKSHLVRLLEELLNRNAVYFSNFDAKNPTASDACTLLGTGSISLLNNNPGTPQIRCLRNRAGQVHGLTLRELSGGLPRHRQAPAIRAASYEILQPSVLVNRIQKIKTFRGHRNAVYCAIFDKSGEYIITGSDDRLVKIWSTATGFCLCSCRGHDGDITDLAVSANNSLLASASNDCFIRVWHFPNGTPVSVLKGHVGAVTAIAFNPRQGCEYLLLSTSDDGTCRIWDARDSSRNPRIYSPRSEGEDNGKMTTSFCQPKTETKKQILCCAFNSSGTVFVTGSSDRLTRVWDACKWSDEVHSGPYHEFDTLRGHEDDVNYVQFSGCASLLRPMNVDSRPVSVGASDKSERFSKFRNLWFGYESIVSCSRDGSAIIWVPRPRKYHGKSKWTKGYHLRVPPPPTPSQPPRGAPRQRLLPTPRGVNMIVWSLDNRYVLAAIMDCRICVWNAVDGSLVHSLTGHTKSTYVLDVHPYDPRIAMSAGYDGRAIIWDIWKGHSIHEYKLGDFHLVDGKFSPDGTSIVISDEVGQIYLLGTGEGRSQKDAKYDQFFLGDYSPLSRDICGNVLDQETQITPHARNMRDLLCDANMIPYAEPYQSTYQRRRLGALGISWQPPPAHWVAGLSDDSSYLTVGFPLLPPEYEEEDDTQLEGIRWVEQPFDEELMDWEQDSEDDAGSDYTLSSENAYEDDDRDCSLTSSEDFAESLYEEDSSEQDDLSPKARLRRSERNKKKEEDASTSGGLGLKRKHRERDSSLRRSKRHKKKKKFSSTRRGSDGEQSRRRPKRLAARNARLFFSRIGAEENELNDSELSEDAEIEDDEQLLSRQSPKDDKGQDLEDILDVSTTEAEPSQIEWSRATRSNPSGRLRASTRKSEVDASPSQLMGAGECSSEDVLEDQIHASTDNTLMDSMYQDEESLQVDNHSHAHALKDSVHEHEPTSNGHTSLTSTSKNRQNLGLTERALNQELNDRAALSGQLQLENTSPTGHVGFETESLTTNTWDGTGNELQREDADLTKMMAGENMQPSCRSLQSEPTIMMDEPNCNDFGSLSRDAGSQQGCTLLVAEEKQVALNDKLERNPLENTEDSVEELSDEGPFVNHSSPSPRMLDRYEMNVDRETSNGREEHVKIFLRSNKKTHLKSCPLTNAEQPRAIKIKHLERDGSCSGKDFGVEDSKAQSTSAINRKETGFIGVARSDQNASLNLSNGLSAHREAVKPVLGIRKHQPIRSSWQHNSPACLWLRQSEDESESPAPSAECGNADEITSDAHEQLCEPGQAFHLKLTFRRGKRKLQRPRRLNFKHEASASDDVCEGADDDREVEDEPQPALEKGVLDEDEFMGKMNVTLTYVRTRRHCNGDRSGTSIHDNKDSDIATKIERREGLRLSLRSRSNTENEYYRNLVLGDHRKEKKVSRKDSWLMLTKVEDGTRYIPQLGDEIAYVFQGQDEFPKLHRLEDKGPPKSLRCHLRAVELCEIVGIEYKTISGFSGVSCKLTLKLIDEECEAMGKTFRLSLPELIDFPDFLIDKSRYDASLKRNWRKRDRCKVWWRLKTGDDDEDEKTEAWFYGRVVGVEPKSSEFPDSPWDSCLVQYKGDSSGPHRHSPWELFDVDNVETIPSSMDEAARVHILSSIEEIEAVNDSNQDDFGLHALSKLFHKADFLNKTLVPVSFDTIKDRLRNKYYRSVKAFVHDAQLLVSNVEDYLSDEELINKVEYLVDRLIQEVRAL